MNNDIKMGFKDHDFHMLTNIAIGSVINAVMVGFRFTTNVSILFLSQVDSINQGNEAKFYNLVGLSSDIMASFFDPILMTAITSERMLKWPVFRTRFKKLIDAYREILDFLGEIVDQHEELLKDSGEDIEPRDFIDAYLIEMKRQKSTNHYFS